MELLARKGNQEKKVQLDLQEWLLNQDLRETRGIRGSVAHSGSEDRKVSEGTLGLLASPERWASQE